MALLIKDNHNANINWK